MQEEELSVSEILSSIRTVLAKETKDLDLGASTEKEFSLPGEEIQPVVTKPIFAPVFPKTEGVFELTPQMRVEKDTFLAAHSLTPSKSVSSAIDQNHIQENLRPMMQDWLDKNLPGIVEKVVTQEVKRLFSGK